MGDFQDLRLPTGEGESRSPFISGARLDNLMIVKNPPDALRSFHIANTPGLKSYSSGASANTAMQGAGIVPDANGATVFWCIADGDIYVNDGAGAGSVVATGALTGLTVSASALCKIVATGLNSAVIVSPADQKAWYCVWNGTIGIGASVTVTAISLPAGTIQDVAWQDGYTIYLRALTDEWYISALDDPTTISALDFTTIDSEADSCLGVISVNRELIVFGLRHLEFYYDSGNASFPFTRQQPGLAYPGISDGNCLAKLDGIVYFVGSDRRIYALRGYSVEPISPEWVESLIPSSGAQYGSAYVDKGQRFYSISFSGASFGSLVYDIDAGAWHTRSHIVGGGTAVYNHAGVVNANGTAFIAANLSTGGGGFYKYDTTAFNDGSNAGNGVHVLRTITLPSFEAAGRRVFEEAVRLDMERTTGVVGTVQLDYADESASSFITHGSSSLAADGDAATSLATDQDLLVWWRAGAYMRRRHRFRILADARIAINAVQHRIDLGAP